ncbi:hypothetical protein SAMN05421505_11730 [Sinosporangium album]|uniref:Uncharacterized protein n=1 Tax=Sinosporangium album TaxID=504805 RepID=A0A1G8CYD6_9ACTN|nr:hypothetical protein SAMN05421505_11730 [Sinosporangium album]
MPVDIHHTPDMVVTLTGVRFPIQEGRPLHNSQRIATDSFDVKLVDVDTGRPQQARKPFKVLRLCFLPLGYDENP